MMSAPRYSIAMTTELESRLHDHLLRSDGQEDLCFALYRPSRGHERETALLWDVVWPEDGERHVHGNASFEGKYFLRAAQLASETESGLALLHSHPGGRGWQQLSEDDDSAERTHAPRAQVLTDHPLVGLTLAGETLDWSARHWEEGNGSNLPAPVESVRVVGGQLRVSVNPETAPRTKAVPTLVRTVSAWGEDIQRTFRQLHVAVVGAGSVGALVAEALARTGVGKITLFDFDRVEELNLDRLVHATAEDARRRRLKVDVAQEALRLHQADPSTQVDGYALSVVEPEGFRRVMDSDVIFSCVDRPWPRHVLNFLAYAHLIPVVDGGIDVDAGAGRMRGAEWRAHIAAPGRRCLVCLNQVDPGLVSVEREGLLDDPSYLRGLPASSPLHRRENVFALSLAAASAEMLQFVSMVAAPGGIADVGAQLFHMTTGTVDREERGCEGGCPYGTELIAKGEVAGFTLTGDHPLAQRARAAPSIPGLGVRFWSRLKKLRWA